MLRFFALFGLLFTSSMLFMMLFDKINKSHVLFAVKTLLKVLVSTAFAGIVMFVVITLSQLTS